MTSVLSPQSPPSLSLTVPPSLTFKFCLLFSCTVLLVQLTQNPVPSWTALSASTTKGTVLDEEVIDRSLRAGTGAAAATATTEDDLAKLAAQLHEKELSLQQKEIDLRNATATAPCSSGEKTYLASRPDVVEAIRHGYYSSGYQHWIDAGRKEGNTYTCRDDIDNDGDDGGSSDLKSSQRTSSVVPVATTIGEKRNDVSPPTPQVPSHPMCQRLMTNSSSTHDASSVTASEIWIQNWDRMLNASFFPHGRIDDVQRDIYRNLMIDVFPRLDDAVLTEPKRQRDVQRIWDILEARRVDPDNSPPLKVLVMGGSVTEGVGCEQTLPSPPSTTSKQQSKKEKDKDKEQQNVRGRTCNWSVRLGEFLNSVLGYDGVEIINVAQGGTATSQAMALVKYWIYPARLGGKAPDVIIHAFGSNDSFLGAFTGDEHSRIKKIFDNNVHILNAFVRTVFSAHSCPMPIIIHLDDYFAGHRQGAFLGDFTFRRVLSMISKWYGNLAISSASVFGPLVYVDPVGEKHISPQWHISKRGKHKGYLNENVHFPYLGHQVVTLSIVYSLLHSAVEFCKDMRINESMEEKSQEMTNVRQTLLSPRVEELKDTLPPPLDFSTDLDTIGEEWWAERDRQQEHCRTTGNQSPCVMAWVAGPEGPTSNAGALQNHLEPYVIQKRRWKYEQDMAHGWARKLGIVAQQNNKTQPLIEFYFKNVTIPLRTFTLQSIKSYGEKWENSQVEVAVKHRRSNSTDWMTIQNNTITGTHNATASISYNTEMIFDEIVQPGDDIRMNITLTGGTTFKITGMMLCSR